MWPRKQPTKHREPSLPQEGVAASGGQPSPARLRHSIAALAVVQVSSYLIPFVTLPYLTRVLGPVVYGKVAFAQVLMTYFVLLVDYGFSLSATRKIAANRNDRAFVSRVFMGTWLAQWLLVVTAALVAGMLVQFSARLRPEAALYAAAFTAVLGTALFPIWFLQGLERLQAVAVIQIVSRVLTLAPIFMLVTGPGDAVLLLLITGGSTMLGGLLALYWVRRGRLVDWCWPGWGAAFHELKDGLSLFGSRLSISFYTIFVPLALGWIAGPVAVGEFQVADKVRAAAQGLLSPVSQALYPRMSLLFKTDKTAATALGRRAALAIVVLAGIGGVLLFALSHWIVLLLAGRKFLSAVSVLRWLAFVPLIVGLSNMFGVQIMLPNQMNKAFNAILIGAGVLGVLAITPLVDAFQADGAAQAVFFIEIFVTVAMGILIQRRGYLFRVGHTK